jgi:hypothetical protein
LDTDIKDPPKASRRWLVALVVALATIGVALAARLMFRGSSPVSPAPTSRPQPARTVSQSRKIYLWRPRVDDVPDDPSAPEVRELRFLLEHATPVLYEGHEGETVPLILRTRFFVSPDDHPHAFALYRAELVRRNPELVPPPPEDQKSEDRRPRAGYAVVTAAFLPEPRREPELRALAAGQRLLLPSGPQFAASEQPELDESVYRDISAQTLSARFGVTVPPTLAGDRALRLLAPFARSFSMSEVVRRRIVPADPSPERRPQSLAFKFQPVLFDYARDESHEVDHRRVTSQYFAAYEPAVVDCQGRCRTTAEVLGLGPPPTPTAPADTLGLLLVADSGVDSVRASTVSPSWVEPDPVKPDGIRDVAQNHHGTFVLSELLEPMRGVLPLERLRIAGVASQRCDGTADWCLDMRRLIAVCNRTLSEWALRREDRSTLVVNLSFAGGTGTGTEDIFRAYPGFLFVVAAGNGTPPKLFLGNELFASENNRGATEGALLVVGALNEDGRSLAPYSNTDPERVDVFAPGSCVCGVGEQLSGTSQAAPVVAAAARLVADTFKGFSPGWVKWRLIAASDIVDDLAGRGLGGVINVGRALERKPVVLTASRPWQAVDRVTFERLAEDAGWQNQIGEGDALAGGVDRTLRLRQKPCGVGHQPGFVCFDQWRLLRGSTSEMTVAATATLRVSGPEGEYPLPARDLQDLVLPMAYRLVDGSVVPRAPGGW